MLLGANFFINRKSQGGLLLLALSCGIQTLFAQKLTHGPFAGGVTSSSAHFYLRVDTVASVNIQISSTSDFTTNMTGASQMTGADNDFTALVRVHGLKANALYYYRAVVNGKTTGEARQFRTFPQEGTRTPFVFTFGSCQQNRPWQSSPDAGRVFTVMARDLPRFFLQIGDWGYPDTTDTALDSTDFFSVEMSRVQASYRAKYDSTYPLQEVLRIAPSDYVYDDHDYANDNASALTAPGAPPLQEIPVSPQARRNSIAGYQQLFPGYPLANSNGGIWHKFTFGNADFFMLDTRSQRSPNSEAFRRNPGTGKYEFAPPPSHSILAGDSTLVGENQRDWLLRELLASKADWKFVVSTITFNRGLRRALDTTLTLQDSSMFIPGFGRVTGLRLAAGIADAWVGFPKDQEVLLEFIRNNKIPNVIILSGDSHTAAIDDGANAGLPELMAGGLDIANSRLAALLELFLIPIWNRGGQTLFSGNFNDAYGRVTVFGADSVQLEIVDEFGRVVARHKVLGGSLPTGISSGPFRPVVDFTLSPNYPNPLRATASHSHTTVRYLLLERAKIAARIHDVLGRTVRRWHEQWQEPGEHELRWDGSDDRGVTLSSGIYFLSVRLILQNGRQQNVTQKIALLR
jgi:alkaline phosphatase D